MKNLVSLLLCAAMLLVCLAPALADTALPIVEEPVTYTVMANLQGNDVNPKELPLQVWLEENTNVIFEWTVLTNAETSERISTVMASGDLPDVFINCLDDSHRLTYGPAGALLPVNEYLQYMPNFETMLQETAGLKAALVLPDGNMYSIPQVNMYSVWPGNGAYVKSTVNINQKWLDAVGMTAPTTTDELVDVLKAFRDLDPNGNGEADEIPMTLQYDGWNNSADGFLFGPFDILGYGTNKNVEDGKVFYAVEDERYVQAVQFIAQLYQEGLIDPEAFTQDGNRYNAKVVEGNVGIYFDWQGDTYANDPNDPTYVIADPVSGPEGACIWTNQSSGINQNYCMISSTAKNPEILCQYFDYMMTEEITVQTLWGAFGDYTQNNGDGTYTRYTGQDYANIWESSVRTMPANFSDELVSRMTSENKDTGVVGDKTSETKCQAAMHYADYCVDEYYPNILLDEASNERLAILWTPVENAIKEKEVAWLTGEANIADEWESFLDEVNALGLSEVREIYQNAYTQAMGE